VATAANEQCGEEIGSHIRELASQVDAACHDETRKKKRQGGKSTFSFLFIWLFTWCGQPGVE